MMIQLNKNFEVVFDDGSYYVGMEIHRNRMKKTIQISQTSYLKKIIQKFKMNDAKSISTPADVNVTLMKSTNKEQVKFPYRQAVGSLMFASTVSRPDICYAVGEVSRYLENPDESHVSALKRILRYLKDTLNLCIEYNASSDKVILEGYTDADFARNIDSRRSTTGYVFMINDSAITWRSTRQKTVALSTTEAECMAACEGSKECIWLRQLLADVGYKQMEATQLNIDNQAAIRLLNNPELHHRTKHIDIRLHFIRELKENETIFVKYVDTKQQKADLFTKPLNNQSLKNNIFLLGMLESNNEWEC